MIDQFTTTEPTLVWLICLIVIGLVMVLYVMRKKVLALLSQTDASADSLQEFEVELEGEGTAGTSH